MPSVTGYAKMCKSTLHYSHHNNHSRKHDDDANYDHDGRLAISSGVAAHEFGDNDSPETTQVMEPGRVLAPNNFIPSKMRCSKRSMSLHRYQLDNVQSQLFHSQWARKPQGDTCGCLRLPSSSAEAVPLDLEGLQRVFIIDSHAEVDVGQSKKWRMALIQRHLRDASCIHWLYLWLGVT